MSLEYFMSVQLLPEHHLEFLSLEGGCTGSLGFTLVKMPHFWKSRAAAQIKKLLYECAEPKIRGHLNC